jgi:hypothetical protein
VTIFSAIHSLKKQISEKEQKLKLGKVTPEDIKKLKDELKKRSRIEKNGSRKNSCRKRSYSFFDRL